MCHFIQSFLHVSPLRDSFQEELCALWAFISSIQFAFNWWFNDLSLNWPFKFLFNPCLGGFSARSRVQSPLPSFLVQGFYSRHRVDMAPLLSCSFCFFIASLHCSDARVLGHSISQNHSNLYGGQDYTPQELTLFLLRLLSQSKSNTHNDPFLCSPSRCPHIEEFQLPSSCMSWRSCVSSMISDGARDDFWGLSLSQV